MPTHITGSATVTPDSTSAATRPAPNTTGRPGKTTGRDVISSWSFAKVMIEPANETEPTRIVNAVAIRKTARMSVSTKCSSSSSATSAAAPPPTPLNNATICGIWVIWTFCAPIAPPAVPIAIATRIRATLSMSSM
jgi:hypothetical protein